MIPNVRTYIQNEYIADNMVIRLITNDNVSQSRACVRDQKWLRSDIRHAILDLV